MRWERLECKDICLQSLWINKSINNRVFSSDLPGGVVYAKRELTLDGRSRSLEVILSSSGDILVTTCNVNKGIKSFSVCVSVILTNTHTHTTWVLFPSTLRRVRPSTLLLCPGRSPITSIAALDCLLIRSYDKQSTTYAISFLKQCQKKKQISLRTQF